MFHDKYCIPVVGQQDVVDIVLLFLECIQTIADVNILLVVVDNFGHGPRRHHGDSG